MIKYSRKFGDRYDAYRVKSNDPFFYIIPQLMTERADSQVFYPDTIDITAIEQFVREHTQTDIPGLRAYHIFIAAAIRTAAEKPYMNRFVIARKIFQRKNYTVSMTIKKPGCKEEAVVKLPFDYTDTLYDVVRKFNEAVSDSKSGGVENTTDKAAGVLSHLPTWLLTFTIGIIKAMDRIGHLPKIINTASPFHTSMFITNVGSIGIGPIYHHIYNFGTTSLFIAIGKKYFKNEINDEGEVTRRHKMDVKFVADERICDGSYWASVFRKYGLYLKNPELLLKSTERIVVDDGINMKGRKPYEEVVGTEIKY